MAIKPLKLTDRGKQLLRISHKNAIAKLEATKERHAKELKDAEEHLADMEVCVSCEHEFDDSAVTGAMLGVNDVTCVKCGYTWYD